jgi:hypothetical protein
MGLKTNLENACIESLGIDAVDEGGCAKLAKAQTDAIVEWITGQTFRITEMKAILEVEQLKTTAPYQADVLPTVMAAPGIPIVNGFGPGASTAPGPLMGGTKGVLVPKVDFSKTGGQGGAMQSKGHAYIGNNPVGSSKHTQTKVKLLKADLVDLG